MANILIIDAGSSSMRGSLRDASGKTLAASRYEYAMESADSVCVEMRSVVFAESLFAVLSEVSSQADKQNISIDALAATSQRSSVLPLDAKGAALHPVVMWHDKRSASICASLAGQCADIYAVCGMRPSPVFSAPKMRWLRENRADVYNGAAKLVGIHDYILFLLTDRFVTDVSLASRTCLFDVRKLEWSETLLDIFGVDRKKLCDVVPAGCVCGTASTKFSKAAGLPEGIPVITAGGDQQCAALGLGVLRRGDVCANSGSGAYVVAVADEPCFDPEMRVLCNAAATPGKWIIEGSVLSAGLVYAWFKRELCPHLDDFAAVGECCSMSPPGAGGLLMIPSLAGKGAPYWDALARGSFHNVSLSTRHEDFARAVLEGLASELADCLDAVREAARLSHFSQIICAGGVTKSDVFNQIQCDTFNAPMSCASGEESTALGAWASASVAVGVHASVEAALEAADAAQERRRYEPDADAAALYARMRKARRLIYETLPADEVRAILNGENAVKKSSL